MKTQAELLSASKKYKKYVWKHFYGRRKKLSLFLSEFEIHEIDALLLLSVEKPIELSIFLGQAFHGLEEIINKPTYNHYQLKKKKGGWRDIYAPDQVLKNIQRKLNHFLQAYYLSLKPDEVHGFIRNSGIASKSNIVANAFAHTNKKYVLNIDLKDFFPNISGQQVYDLFSSSLFGYNEQIATALTLLVTINGSLPIGAPTSPVVSNFVCLELDASLKRFAAANSVAYTRYADDLTFSFDQPITKEMQSQLESIIQDSGFIVNEKKVRLITTNRKQTVTGLIVNKKVNVDRKLQKKVRAMLHDLSKNGLDSATQKHLRLPYSPEKQHRALFMNRLVGYINFIGQVKGKSDSVYARFIEKLEGVLMGAM